MEICCRESKEIILYGIEKYCVSEGLVYLMGPFMIVFNGIINQWRSMMVFWESTETYIECKWTYVKCTWTYVECTWTYVECIGTLCTSPLMHYLVSSCNVLHYTTLSCTTMHYLALAYPILQCFSWRHLSYKWVI